MVLFQIDLSHVKLCVCACAQRKQLFTGFFPVRLLAWLFAVSIWVNNVSQTWPEEFRCLFSTFAKQLRFEALDGRAAFYLSLCISCSSNVIECSHLGVKATAYRIESFSFRYHFEHAMHWHWTLCLSDCFIKCSFVLVFFCDCLGLFSIRICEWICTQLNGLSYTAC